MYIYESRLRNVWDLHGEREKLQLNEIFWREKNNQLCTSKLKTLLECGVQGIWKLVQNKFRQRVSFYQWQQSCHLLGIPIFLFTRCDVVGTWSREQQYSSSSSNSSSSNSSFCLRPDSEDVAKGLGRRIWPLLPPLPQTLLNLLKRSMTDDMNTIKRHEGHELTWIDMNLP
jgi:hypothetical protein